VDRYDDLASINNFKFCTGALMSIQTEVPEIGTTGLLRFAWRQLTSMRTALILLILLGLASIPGSLLPQRSQNPIAVRQYFIDSPQLARWIDRFAGFTVYSSPWFSAIYILLFISLIGCVLPRTVEHFKAMRALPPATPRNLSRMESFESFEATGSEFETGKAWLKSKRFRIRSEDNSISAEKGYLRETGNLLFHLSLILILVGVSVGSLFGMRGEAIVNQGERFIGVPTSYDTLTFGKLVNENRLQPFVIEVQKFEAEYDLKTNAPLDYTATVKVTNAGETDSEVKSLKVNSPLTFGNTRVYLQANGYSPIVTVRDAIGQVSFQGPVPFLPQDGNLRSIGSIKVPDMQPQLGFVSTFLPTYSRSESDGGISVFPSALNPRLLFSIWAGDLGLDSGKPQSVYRIDTSNMERIELDSLSPGETFTFDEGSITFEALVPWINLQIVDDPGKAYALYGAIAAILGLLASLFGRRRRIWIRITDSGVVEVAGLAKNGAPGLADEISELVVAMRKEK
jgi:cytochrome c biogenesis protein